MRFFIDTANLEQIKEAGDLGVLDGVTTNPSIMAKQGIIGKDRVAERYRAICELVDGDVSAEVISTDYEGIIAEGEELSQIAPNIVVKVPMIRSGVQALRYFFNQGIRTNCTLVFSAGQALLAGKAGATYISPFIGRVNDLTWDGMALISEIAELYAIQGFETEILAASVRSSKDIVDAAKAGADIVTCRLEYILGLLNHPLTQIGLDEFLADHHAANP